MAAVVVVVMVVAENGRKGVRTMVRAEGETGARVVTTGGRDVRWVNICARVKRRRHVWLRLVDGWNRKSVDEEGGNGEVVIKWGGDARHKRRYGGLRT